jgi:hypothetical protein
MECELCFILQIHETVLRGSHDLVLLDLKSAYDRVDPERLLVKLAEQGFPVIFRCLTRSLFTGGTGKCGSTGVYPTGHSNVVVG